MAGCATARALCRAGLGRVVVVEAHDPPRSRPVGGETLPPDALQLLRLLGLADAFLAEAHLASPGSAACWGSPALGRNDHFLHPLGRGWHLDRPRFDRWMAAAARSAGARWIGGHRVATVRGGPSRNTHWEVTLDDGRTLRARAVVDATGPRAAVARQLGALRLAHDQLVYLAATLPPLAAPPGQTLLEARPEGWWFAAGLPGGRWTVALATDADRVRALAAQSAAGWWRLLQATTHLAPRLAPGPAPDAAPTAEMAPSALTAPPGGPGWLAVGDAAASHDPLSSRGITSALQDGLRAAEALATGTEAAIADHVRTSVLAYRAYLAQRAQLYDQERRWADAPFWARRRARRGLRRPDTVPHPAPAG